MVALVRRRAQAYWGAQKPEQSAPPAFGSQSSRGSNTHRIPGGQRSPAIPAHCGDVATQSPGQSSLLASHASFGSSTQTALDGHGGQARPRRPDPPHADSATAEDAKSLMTIPPRDIADPCT